MTDCPCCSRLMLRHIAHNQAYWFCPHCREKMPDLSAIIVESESKTISHEFTDLVPLSVCFSEAVLAAKS